MAITEFMTYLRCQACDQRGFSGRSKIEETPCAMEYGDPIQMATIWHWDCKFCGIENEFIYSV